MDLAVIAMCASLGCPPGVEVRVLTGREYPDPCLGAAACTTRQADGEGCRIFFRVAKPIELIQAHEACHCARDYHRITDVGWKLPITKQEVDARERRARECAIKIVWGGQAR